MPDELHFITCFFNPLKWRSRRENFERFYESLRRLTNNVHVVECTYGDAEPEIDVERSHQVRVTGAYLWIKENLLNVALRRLPASCRYVAWLDSDVLFENERLIEDTIDALRRWKLVQLFTRAHHLLPDGQIESTLPGFGWGHLQNVIPHQTHHEGFAWAIRRECLEKFGGLFEYAILGGGDAFMAGSAVGRLQQQYLRVYFGLPHRIIETPFHPEYLEVLRREGARWREEIDGSVGCVPGDVRHLWHGPLNRRYYRERRLMLARHQFNPNHDLRRNAEGVLEWNGNEPLQAALSRVAKLRSEDEDEQLSRV
jgi:hypothetical protein